MEFQSIQAGILSVVPPLIAIALALISKEVIFSLLFGILSGTLIYSIAAGIGIIAAIRVASDLMVAKVAENASMLIFLSMLGALVAVVTKAGGSRAYGLWASKRLKSPRGAGFSTVLLGMILFIDDYFNCLTVGTIMRPITDSYKISREKLAYFIDSTAAPVSIIAPVSSWAAAVISYYPAKAGMSGMQAFVSSIPMNLYALLSIFMIFWLSFHPESDYGPMRRAQIRAQGGQIKPDDPEETDDEIARMKSSGKGMVLDMVIPVLCLVIFCVIAMLFYGGFYKIEGSMGERIFEAFGHTETGLALSLGGFGSLLVSFILFIPRKIIKFTEFFSAITTGIKSMVPAIIILSLAWTISAVCRDLLSTGPYVAGLVQHSNFPVMFIPAIMFVIAASLSFATGTSWGTFGILIPIVISVCAVVAPWLSVTSLSAVLAGSVFGDHCSPISDTTILASTGAQCRFIDHVQTQIPYAMTVAAISFTGYIIAGLTSTMGYGVSVAITLPSSLAMLTAVLIILPKVTNKAEA